MRRGGLAALALALFGASVALAQEQNPQALPIGEEALGLGGAYTGRALDASAAYYNPGGLALGRSGGVSASLSLGLVDRYVLEGARDDFALDFQDAFGVPFYVGGAAQFGDRMADGELRHAVAASIMTPIQSRRRFVIDRQRDGDITSLRIRRTDVTQWYGISYALRVVEELGLGATLFLTTRSFAHEEQAVDVRADELFVRSTRAELTSEQLVLRLGALYRLAPTFSIGLMVQLPAIELGARGTVGGVRGVGEGGGVESAFVLEEGIGARAPVPWQARLGLAWSPSREVGFTTDLALVGPLGSREEPVLRFEPASARAPGAAGDYLAVEWWSDWTVDVAVGGRFVIDRVPVSLGFFTALSSAPVIPDAITSTYQPDRLDLLGASVNVGYRGDNFELTVGLVGTLGIGRGLRALPASGLGPVSYEPVGLESQTLYVFVTGAGGAVEVFGRTLADELERFIVPREERGSEPSPEPSDY